MDSSDDDDVDAVDDEPDDEPTPTPQLFCNVLFVVVVVATRVDVDE